MSKAILRDYECRLRGEERGSVRSALSSGKARYQYFLDAQDFCPDLKITDIVVRSLGPHQEPQWVRDAQAFNAVNPIGTLVMYWTGLREGIGCISRTRTTAQVISDHASVWMENQVGSVCLSHVEVIHG